MNVSLTPELEQFVQEKVKSGRCLGASEVVRSCVAVVGVELASVLPGAK